MSNENPRLGLASKVQRMGPDMDGSANGVNFCSWLALMTARNPFQETSCFIAGRVGFELFQHGFFPHDDVELVSDGCMRFG